MLRDLHDIGRLLGQLGMSAGKPRCPSPPAFPYDVFVFPVVDWYDRFQRPQHLSVELGNMGARVFYCGNRFVPSLCLYEPEIRQVARNVFWTKLPGTFNPPDIYADIPSEVQIAAITEGVQRIRDRFNIGTTLSIVDYPFWAPIARQIPNTVVLYDCMDAYTSFGNAGRPARELEPEMAACADLVVCSSQHLQNSIRVAHRCLHCRAPETCRHLCAL